MWANRKSLDKDYETASGIRFQDRFKPVSLNNCSSALPLPQKNSQEMPRSTNIDKKEAFESTVSNSNTWTPKKAGI